MKKQAIICAICTFVTAMSILFGESMPFGLFSVPVLFVCTFAVETAYSMPTMTATTAAINLVLALFSTNDLFYTFGFVLLMIISGILTGIVIVKKWNPYYTAVTAGMSTGGVIFAYIIYSINFLGVNPVENVLSIVPVIFEKAAQLSETGFDVEMVKQVVDLMRNTLVATLIIFTVATGYIIAYITSKFINIPRGEHSLNVTFKGVKADSITVFVYVMTFLLPMFIDDSTWSVVFMNVSQILSMYLLICGISLVYSIIRAKIRAPKIVHILMIGATFALSAVSLVALSLTVFAMIDARRNFRRLDY